VEHATDRLCGSVVRTILRRGQGAMSYPTTLALLSLINAISIAFGLGADYLAIAQNFSGELGTGA
ncbi:hypothetical protein, partial [Pseudomonas sp. AH2 (2023)]|uniref:hypothetical protein n=1 Tax=Pseudomonas sp. AH2 (2023) TaxID=3048599 RepID=UPI002B22F47E